MRVSRRLLPLILLVITAVLLLFIFLRPDTQAAFGPAVTLCPGPDLYGYTCAGGTGFAYIDATQDTGLYEDDGTATIALPFPFTFYGTTHTSLQASSNGTLQFGNDNPTFNNECLTNGPINSMGAMIAPFWDDLDLRFWGYLETDVVGEAPDRIFVIEWDDVPRFEDDTDRVTFEVQLFETSQDIIFLYEDVTLFAGSNGSGATIGLQSAVQGVALQYSCNQPAVADATRLLFAHPETANEVLSREVVMPLSETVPVTAVKGDVLELVTKLNRRGETALSQLRGHWLSQSPPRYAKWAWADLTGNGRSDLLLLRHSTTQFPDQTELAVLTQSLSGEYTVALNHTFSTRETAVPVVDLVQFVDLTGDGLPDALLQDGAHNQLFVITAVNNTLKNFSIPEQCRGSLAVMDLNQDGQPEIVRDHCSTPGRHIYQWDGTTFSVMNN